MADMIPAATLIVMRESAGTPPKYLMMRRHAALAFAGDAWVFPGGRVDSDDRALAARTASADLDDLAGRICAVRETIEEVGLAIGLAPARDPVEAARLRDRLAAGDLFSGLLDTAGLRIVAGALIPFARWAPPPSAPRRFDTRFYLARIDRDDPVSIDGSEGVDLCWTTAAAMLERFEAGDARMLFPTRANLARLAPFESFAAALAAARATPVRLIETILERQGDASELRIPEGHGYPPLTMTLNPARSRF